MTSMINPETFEATEDQPSHGYWVNGTVEVTIRNETRRVPANMVDDIITAFGLTGRYQTGSRAWPAKVTRNIDPRTGNAWDKPDFGRDERSGRCKKTSSIFFQ